MKKLLLIAGAAALFAGSALAADLGSMPTKARVASGYPTTRCGMYYGLGTGGSATAVNGGVVGERIVQGELDAILGYTCPIGGNGFWFVEGSVGFNNINGATNGLSLSGPLVMIQRIGGGSPINGLFNPFGNSISLPSLPALPNGVTAGPANGYFFAGVVEQDVSAQFGLMQNKQWVIAPLLGMGMLTRLSDGVVVDTWAGWQMNSNSICLGGRGGGCVKEGNGARVGVSFKY